MAKHLNAAPHLSSERGRLVKVGYFGGKIWATITDNTGARYVIKDEKGVIVSSSNNPPPGQP